MVKTFVITLNLCLFLCASVFGQSQTEMQSSSDPQVIASEAAKDLANRNPLIRQQGAEVLAKLADPGQLTITEGYRLQEKNARVRLALDWALYRMGKNESLFSMVKDLDTERQVQAIVYLSLLESPEPLYKFVDRGRPTTQAGLFEVFARIGDDQTLTLVSRYVDASIPEVAKAARLAQDQITLRLLHRPADVKGRQRRAGDSNAEQSPTEQSP